MDATFLVIILTFIVGIFGIIKETPVTERKGIFKKLNIPNFLFLLITILLTIQVYEHFDNRREKETQNAINNNTYDGVKTTIDKVHEVNKSIDSILENLQKEINYTKSEFNLIASINHEMTEVRKDIYLSLNEYKNLNQSYTEQLKLEKQKVFDTKPDVRAVNIRSVRDSNSIVFQFHLSNFGKRIADSVKFNAIMLLTDPKLLKIKRITQLKSNINTFNILSLSPDQENPYVANGLILYKNEISNYGDGFLLIKLKYYDHMTNSTIEKPLQIYNSPRLIETGIQYGSNIDPKNAALIERYLYKANKEYYKLFFD